MIARAEFAASAPLAPTPPPNDLSAPVEDLDQPSRWRRFAVWVAAALIMALGAGVYLLWSRQHGRPASSYVTKVVTRGNLSLSVTANGTLQPTRTVNIGSELSGTVTRVLVDVNDRVKKDQLLVELDTAKLRDQVERSRATLASSVAKVAVAVATVKESQAQLGRLQEVSRLSGGKVPSKSEIDSGQATFERAQADEAAARAAVNDAKAALSTDETNLAKASIRSPTDGVVLTRAVDPGNAVASSLQAVTLFTIAEDLTKMKLQINVDEADVGLIGAGQTATFSVSAYPSHKYPAKITRVAYGSTISENVVTYIAYLAVANSDLSLRPGMTATATIDATERRDVLLVPNAALRFTPSMANVAAPGGGPQKGGGLMDSLLPRPPAVGAGARAPTVAATGRAAARKVWILRDGQPMQIAVEPGVSDGKMTEIESAGQELQPGMQVIVDQRSAANS